MKKIKKILKSKKIEYFILLSLVIGAFAVRLYKVKNPIADWHSWRQADTASVSWIYAQEGIDLLHPKYFDVSKVQTGYENPEGYRFVEFPIFNAIHAYLYNAYPSIGFDTWGRLVPVLGATLTTASIYTIGVIIGGSFVGLAAAFFYAFLPYNIYFTRVVLPDPLATSFGVFSVMLFLIYFKRERSLFAYLGAAMMSIALLIKPNVAFFGLPLIFLAIKKYGFLGVFKNKPLLISLDIALIPFFLWRWWIAKFPMGIPHLAWAFNGDGIRFRPSFWRWIFGERVGTMILGVWGLIPFSFALLKPTKEKLTKHFTIAWLLSGILYVSILATANVRHDYYQVFLVPPISLGLAVGIQTLYKSKIFKRVYTIPLIFFSLFIAFNITLDKVRGFYEINHPEIVEAGEAANKLLPKDAKVIAPYNGDTAFLYQTKRYGFPIIVYSIEDNIQKGADYYISVNKGDADTTMLKNMYQTIKEENNYIILDLHKPL